MNDTNVEEIMSTSNNHEFDKKYLDDFRKAIWNITDESLLIKSIPNPRFNGYIELLVYLKEYAEDEVKSVLEDLDITSDELDRKYLKEELEVLRKRIVVFEEKIDEYQQKETMEEKADKNIGERNLIYLKSKAGNVLVESDVDDIPKEELQDVEEAFAALKKGDFSSDLTKFRIMNQMQNLKGVREVKNYQARIYFYHIEENVSLVSLIQIKKNDFSKKEKERIVNRAQLMYDSLDDIREMLNDPIKREKILDEGRKITTRIEEKISSRKRGSK